MSERATERQGAALTEITAARKALARAQDIYSVLEIRDVAKAAGVFAEAQDAGEAANEAKAVQLRAERKAGEMLSGLERGAGGRPPENSSQAVTSLSDYAEALETTNTNRQTANRWQKLSQIPDDDFEQYMRNFRNELTQAGALRLARKLNSTKEEPEEEPVRSTFTAQRGELWELGEHRLFCGDVYNPDHVRRIVEGQDIDALITDPPYGIDYSPEWERWDGSPGRFSPIEGDEKDFDPRPFLDFDTVVLFGAQHFSPMLPVGGWICWDKRLSAEKDRMVGSPFELAWFKSRHTERRSIMIRVLHGGVVNADSQNGNNELRFIATQKPVQVMREILEHTTAIGETVFDPFAGSGSTLLACEHDKRRCLALEIDPENAAIILQRWADLTGGEPCQA